LLLDQAQRSSNSKAATIEIRTSCWNALILRKCRELKRKVPSGPALSSRKKGGEGGTYFEVFRRRRWL
jgi:hypothetical protein